MASIFELQNPPFGQLTKTKVIKTENGAHTLTTAELIEGIVDGTPTGNRAITTPTAAEILTALGVQYKVGQFFELTIVNKANQTYLQTLLELLFLELQVQLLLVLLESNGYCHI